MPPGVNGISHYIFCTTLRNKPFTSVWNRNDRNLTILCHNVTLTTKWFTLASWIHFQISSNTLLYFLQNTGVFHVHCFYFIQLHRRQHKNQMLNTVHCSTAKSSAVNSAKDLLLYCKHRKTQQLCVCVCGLMDPAVWGLWPQDLINITSNVFSRFHLGEYRLVCRIRPWIDLTSASQRDCSSRGMLVGWWFQDERKNIFYRV